MNKKAKEKWKFVKLEDVDLDHVRESGYLYGYTLNMGESKANKKVKEKRK